MALELNMKKLINHRIQVAGGWVNCHAHIDRAYTLTDENHKFQKAHINEKWHLHDKVYRESTIDDLVNRMSRAVDLMIDQGVTGLCSFLNADYAVEDKAFLAGQIVKEKYKNRIEIKFTVNTFKGLLNADGRHWFEVGAEYADIISGTPRSDFGNEAEHLDVVFQTAKRMGKMIHVHVDELHKEDEREIELLCDKTVEYGMQGRVVGVHGISLSRQTKEYRQKIYKKLKEAEVMMVTCPTAWMDHKRTEELVPFHQAIFPVDEALANGIVVGLGTDNFEDYTLPFGDGDMWTELRVIAAVCRYAEADIHIDDLVKIATVNGRKILGLE